MNNYICLQNIRSLYNIGAIFRTCSFFGFYNVILLGYSGKIIDKDGGVILNHKILKTSVGSEKDLKIKMFQELCELKNFCDLNNLKIISIEQSTLSEDIYKFKKQNNFKNSVIVFGNEIMGISLDLINISDHILEIKKHGIHNSLNVTTACGIVLDIIKN